MGTVVEVAQHTEGEDLPADSQERQAPPTDVDADGFNGKSVSLPGERSV